MAGKSGAKLIGMPTCDLPHVEHTQALFDALVGLFAR
jgi:hypothetical protein